MSIRKLKRSIIRAEAKKKNYPEHKYLTYFWNELQIKLRGINKRSINMTNGTKPKHLWKSRRLLAEGLIDRQRDARAKAGVK